MNNGTKIKKIRKSGFRARKNTVSGRRIIKKRRKRGRINIT
uniref:Ribosomal protein L34 n=1 Tax=Taenioma perpusillum TaxID=210852 RepID=A0A1Z1MQP4_9FLOR|nr:ribosomal protein L34 [Taenioma perpusillum]ARW68407.1 ribosomal protein L34 [Taenioma perpusillum]